MSSNDHQNREDTQRLLKKLKKNSEEPFFREKKFRTLFENSVDGILVADITTKKLILANPRILEILGYTHKELIGMSVADIHPKKDLGFVLDHFKRQAKGKLIMAENLPVLRKDKKVIYCDISTSPIEINGRKILIGSFRDMSYKKKTEDSMKKLNDELTKANRILLKEKEKVFHEKEKLEVILKSVTDGIFVLDKNKKIVLVNQSMQNISGFTEKDLLGKKYFSYLKFFSETKNKPYNDFINNIYSRGKHTNTVKNIHLIKKDRMVIPVAYSAMPLINNGHKIAGCVVLIHDISKEQELNNMKTEFISIVSHQLRTPLTGIKWFTQMILDEKAGKINKKQKLLLKDINISNERMIKLVSDLLSISHIEIGRKFDIVKSHICIYELMKDIKHNLIVSAQKKHIDISISSNFPKKLKLFIDKEKIFQIFFNLINNAIKYTYKYGKIQIGYKKDKAGQAIISIKDSGIGIPKEQQSQIFEKFFRATNTVDISETGTGLGLYITKAITEAHGGKIWFISTENIGTTFFVSLPIPKKK